MVWVQFPDRPKMKTYYPTLVLGREASARWLDTFGHNGDSMFIYQKQNSKKPLGFVNILKIGNKSEVFWNSKNNMAAMYKNGKIKR